MGLPCALLGMGRGDEGSYQVEGYGMGYRMGYAVGYGRCHAVSYPRGTAGEGEWRYQRG